ncbi:hypothetical protein [Pseudomonas fluorescens]|uniref:Uncharacterized protein n=1 Tax=Pseudomonas fluorescens TaxID=294 RepID=A0A0F4TNW1_PSEFL|nr:hypothetical protein [Pseudomonas fluorescens]KJZ45749.1 hypothetical protein VC34_09490 [Pseudomonas fluorescens]
MDYPNSVPSAGLVDVKFVDETPIMGTPTSFSSLVATRVGGDGAMLILVESTGTKQGCRLKARNFSGQVQAGWSVN